MEIIFFQELVNISELLKKKIQVERREIASLKDKLQECIEHKEKGKDSSSNSSFSSSSDSSSDDDEEEDTRNDQVKSACFSYLVFFWAIPFYPDLRPTSTRSEQAIHCYVNKRS